MSEESDIRVLIAEMRADQRANSQSSQQVAKELSSVAKELHSIGKAFTAQTVIVQDLKESSQDHEKRLRTVEDAVASERPFKDLRAMIIRGVIVFIVAGIMGAAFIVNK